ncbi:MAG: homoserine O-succinyltransferase [Oscillospiraceae bacterium]|jgi:homoserine O-succinyltransferase|nr:homoserine O-succinyltransferase [Oscillospiraceae bacterium]
MPIKIDSNLPAHAALAAENVFVMTAERAARQDIRPLRILILNLMPTKVVTETQLLRLLSNSPLQVDITLMQMSTHTAKNTDAGHMAQFYKTHKDICHERFDGMILTGAPVETLAFEDVDYWDELCRILQWSRTNVYSLFAICWGAQAALHYFYGVPKYTLAQKQFGVYPHRILVPLHPALRGMDDVFWAPHSRHTGTRRADIEAVTRSNGKPILQVLAQSEEAGVFLAADWDCRQFFATGHLEYDRDTLKGEYDRDRDKGLDIAVPEHYFPHDDPTQKPLMRWRGAANILFTNWLNYFVYQQTPFDLTQICTVDEASKETMQGCA